MTRGPPEGVWKRGYPGDMGRAVIQAEEAARAKVLWCRDHGTWQVQSLKDQGGPKS